MKASGGINCLGHALNITQSLLLYHALYAVILSIECPDERGVAMGYLLYNLPYVAVQNVASPQRGQPSQWILNAKFPKCLC